ncbi:MAG: hypothetical protein NT120_02345 [Candidatus Aenigmarchaeota archaeon]|nr:hypothetical protein [Candidatus Aenigmarchaeota archaeon]
MAKQDKAKDSPANRQRITEREKRIKQLISREYKIYQEEERQASLPRTLYEKACNKSEKIIKAKPDAKTKQKLDEAIEFSHLKITPEGVVSLTVVYLLLVIIPTLFLIILNIVTTKVGLPFGYGVTALMLELFFLFYIYVYPFNLKKRYEMSVGSDVVTFVIYIIMFMRNTPSLEGAVKFAAEHITGDLGYELKKLLWDVEVGNYLSMEDAILDYSKKWTKNRPFIESVQLVITSLRQMGPKRIEMLDEAVNIILDGNREQARDFNQKLKLPVTIVNALGIILPVMGLVMFPIIAVFLKVEAMFLFVGYDVILPIVLYMILTNIMIIRPATFSRIDIAENPDVPPEGKFKYRGKNVPAWPIALIVGIIIIAVGMFLYVDELSKGPSFEGIVPATVIVMGIAVGFGLYFILLTNQRLKVREQTKQIETEFAEALFQLGSQISGGSPIEISLENSIERIKTLKIRDLFVKALKNMKLLGFTFEKAFFDENYGAVRYYPSRLIKSIMHTVVESSRKGVNTASSAMLSVSRYLKDLHKTQEDIKESLSETLNSLKFQGFFLTPMISGVVATLAIIIIRILRQLGTQSASLGSDVPLLSQFAEISITPFQFILIVAIYMVESSFILGMFINSIENGEDPVGQKSETGYTLLIGSIVFMACLFLTLAVFAPLISSLM